MISLEINILSEVSKKFTKELQIHIAVYLRSGKYYDQGTDTFFDVHLNLAAGVIVLKNSNKTSKLNLANQYS